MQTNIINTSKKCHILFYDSFCTYICVCIYQENQQNGEKTGDGTRIEKI